MFFSRLFAWLQDWNKNNAGNKRHTRPHVQNENNGAAFKIVILSGPAGVGKTITTTLVCRSLGYEMIVFDEKDLQNHTSFPPKSETIKRVILVKGIDQMKSTFLRDNAVKKAEKSAIPVIFICNDSRKEVIGRLFDLSHQIYFGSPQMEQIRDGVQRILKKEGLNPPREMIEEAIRASDNDIRKTLKKLSSIKVKPDTEASVTRNDNGRKTSRSSPWELVRNVMLRNRKKDSLKFENEFSNKASAEVSGPSTSGKQQLNDNDDEGKYNLENDPLIKPSESSRSSGITPKKPSYAKKK